jgi:hypothetical protein
MAMEDFSHKQGWRWSRPRPSTFRYILDRMSNLFRSRKAESLLLKSLKNNYPKWVESGLVKPSGRSTPSDPYAVLSSKSSK